MVEIMVEVEVKVVLCCFLPNISPHTKLHPNQVKNIVAEKIGQRWLAGMVGQKIALAISNSFFVASETKY